MFGYYILVKSKRFYCTFFECVACGDLIRDDFVYGFIKPNGLEDGVLCEECADEIGQNINKG